MSSNLIDLDEAVAAAEHLDGVFQRTMEHGVKWINQQEAEKFEKEHPGLIQAIHRVLNTLL
jgi:hypothetical protein